MCRANEIQNANAFGQKIFVASSAFVKDAKINMEQDIVLQNLKRQQAVEKVKPFLCGMY